MPAGRGCGCWPPAAASSSATYGIVRQLFEPLLASAASDLRQELLGPAALVEPLVGVSRPAASEDEAAEGSFAILHGLYWLAANVAFQQPTLLAIDDLYWADPFPALAPLPDAEARGSASCSSPRRRGRWRERAVIPHLLRS